MPRLRSKSSGVVVNVSDEVARTIAHRFEPVEADEPQGEKKPARRRSAAKKSDEK